MIIIESPDSIFRIPPSWLSRWANKIFLSYSCLLKACRILRGALERQHTHMCASHWDTGFLFVLFLFCCCFLQLQLHQRLQTGVMSAPARPLNCWKVSPHFSTTHHPFSTFLPFLPFVHHVFFFFYAGKTSRWNRVPLYLESVSDRFPLYWKWQSHLSAPEFRVRDPLISFLIIKDHKDHINCGRPYGNCTDRKPRPCTVCMFAQSNARNLFAFKKGSSIWVTSEVKVEIFRVRILFEVSVFLKLLPYSSFTSSELTERGHGQIPIYFWFIIDIVYDLRLCLSCAFTLLSCLA